MSANELESMRFVCNLLTTAGIIRDGQSIRDLGMKFARLSEDEKRMFFDMGGKALQRYKKAKRKLEEERCTLQNLVIHLEDK